MDSNDTQEDPRTVLRDAMILLYEHRHLLSRYDSAVELMHEGIAQGIRERHATPLMFNLMDLEKRVDALGIDGITDGYENGRPLSEIEKKRSTSDAD